MEASTWVSQKDNLVTRELLFRYRLCYDLALAAAHRNSPLGILSVDVDRFGWDLALDDGDEEHRAQLKVVSPDANTGYWNVRKQLPPQQRFTMPTITPHTITRLFPSKGTPYVCHRDPL